jgi:hypothetical protein
VLDCLASIVSNILNPHPLSNENCEVPHLALHKADRERWGWFILRGLGVDCCCYKYFDGSGTLDGMAMELFWSSGFSSFLTVLLRVELFCRVSYWITTSITELNSFIQLLPFFESLSMFQSDVSL